MVALLKTKNFYFVIYIFFILLLLINNSLKADQEIRIISDKLSIDQEENIITGKGDVLILGKEISSKAYEVTYNRNEGFIESSGDVILKDKFSNTYFADEITFTDDSSYLNAKNVKMRLKDESRVVGSQVIKKDEINVISDVEYTPCLKENYLIKNCPGWKLKANKMYHNLDTKTVHYDHALIHIFNLPIFYLPYFAHPDPSVNKRTGFLMPTIQSDDQLGDTISIPFFYNIAGNKDITFTPNIQSDANNFYEVDYRHLNDVGSFEINASIDDNDNNLGTRNHVFANANINNSYGTLKTYIQTSNNDTYMRRMKLNDLTVFKSGIYFQKTNENTNLSIESNAYKHLTRQDSQQWEYMYPQINFDIDNIKDNKFGGIISIHNDLINHKNLDNSYSSLISSQANWMNTYISNDTGILYDNNVNFRVVSSSVDYKGSESDENTVAFYPQISSKLSLPLIKVDKNHSQTLTPILMPILAPYNNYTDAQTVDASNIFSNNRSAALNSWESGPRINYGLEWFLDLKDNLDLKLTVGQSAKVNKHKSDSSDEVSDYMIASKIIFDPNKYIDHTAILDRKNRDIKGSNIHAYFDYNKFRFAIDHDYTSNKYSTGSEQIKIGANVLLANDFSFNFTGTRDLNTSNNIGYQYGLLYENDCLGINFNYYRDLTKDRDIAESEGLSFTIVLKPFGSTKSYGSKKLFGPEV